MSKLSQYLATLQIASPKPFKDRDTGFRGWRVELELQRAIPTPAVSDGRWFVAGGFGGYDFNDLDARPARAAGHLRTKETAPTPAVRGTAVGVSNPDSCPL